MNTKTKREQRRKKHQRQQLTSNLMWGGIAIAVATIIGLIIWQGIKPAAGEAIPEMVEVPHILPDTDPGQYNSDPPTSGPHYAQEAEAGFFDANIYTYPAAYLVHNLEHGYVIFWYNCDLLDESACSELKSKIRSVMNELGGTKLIAYPWPSIDVPLVITSWGRLQRFETFDTEKAKAFYNANLNRSPEPNAP
ncbi:MAG TPA: DUF3105 domain-containing protein [Anaerolineales bacterium]|nr:DUF3105 domain-containing protein [Anaerolineales bacterium]